MKTRHIAKLGSYIKNRGLLPFSHIFKKGELRIVKQFVPDRSNIQSILTEYDYVLDPKTLTVYKTKDVGRKNPTKLGRVATKIIRSMNNDLMDVNKNPGLMCILNSNEPEWVAFRKYYNACFHAERDKLTIDHFYRHGGLYYTSMFMYSMFCAVQEITSYPLGSTTLYNFLSQTMGHSVLESCKRMVNDYDTDLTDKQIESVKMIIKAMEEVRDASTKKLDIYNKRLLLETDALNACKYHLVISRSPIDVIRMSDFNHIQSCHSPGSDYFKCAIEEARGNGGVIYIITDADKKKIKDLQADEIFKDSDRGVDGIVPVSRIRIRRVLDLKTNTEYAVLERSIYGKKLKRIVKRSLKWLRKVQPIDKGLKIDFDTFVYVGGSYYDCNPGILLAKMAKKPSPSYYELSHENGDCEWDEGK